MWQILHSRADWQERFRGHKLDLYVIGRGRGSKITFEEVKYDWVNCGNSYEQCKIRRRLVEKGYKRSLI